MNANNAARNDDTTTLDPLPAAPTQAEIARMRAILDNLSGAAPDAAKAPEAPVTATVTGGISRRRNSRKGENMTPQTLQSAPAQGTQHPQSNVLPFETLLAIATDLGTQAGQGTDTQIRFDLKVVEASFLGTVDLSPGKHGKEIDDASRLGEAYAKARNGSVVFNPKAANQRKLISNIRTCIKGGMYSKGGTGEPLQTINTLMTLWQKMRRDPSLGKKMDDAHNTLMRFIRAQLKLDSMIDSNQLKDFCVKRETEARSGEEVLESIRKIANNLKAGRVPNCPDTDNSPEVLAIIANCTKRIVAITKAKTPSKTAA